MYILLLIIHVVVCLVLILVVLLQAGRGGGFSDMMGGGQPQSLFGTDTNAFMTKATEICAVIFIITSLSLGILSTQRGKSLIEKEMRARALRSTVPASSTTAAPLTPAAAASAAAPVASPVSAPAQKPAEANVS